MQYTHNASLFLIPVLLTAAPGLAAERVIDSAPGTDVDIPSTGATRSVTFTKASEPATGFAIDARWTAVNADTSNGLFPWSLDLSVEITDPGGNASTWGPLIFGDRTIADYPMQDGDPVLSGATSSGAYELVFDSGAPSPWIAGLRDVTYYLTTTVPDVTYAQTVTPDPAQMWDRPFAINGVSGLGPVAFDAFEFTVGTSGVYEFTSELMPADDHFTFLYEGAFDSEQPLANLLDYGLGNGFSPFDVPEGTSTFGALLFEGETYIWVTSQWSSSSAISPAQNSIVGPGAILPAGGPACPGDCDGSGAVDFSDLVAVLGAFGSDTLSCDADGSGTVNFSDLVATLGLFGPCE